MADLKRPGDVVTVEDEAHDNVRHVATARVKVIRGKRLFRGEATVDASDDCAMAQEISRRLAAGETSGRGPVGLLQIRLANLRNPPDARFSSLLERVKYKAQEQALEKHEEAERAERAPREEG